VTLGLLNKEPIDIEETFYCNFTFSSVTNHSMKLVQKQLF